MDRWMKFQKLGSFDPMILMEEIRSRSLSNKNKLTIRLRHVANLGTNSKAGSTLVIMENNGVKHIASLSRSANPPQSPELFSLSMNPKKSEN